MLTEKMLATVQYLMFVISGAGGSQAHPIYQRLERIETYLIQRFNRE
jgi:hypothetical protein